MIIGVALGLESETRSQDSKSEKINSRQRIGGIRTYTLLSILGGIAGLFFLAGEKIFTYMLFGAVIVFLFAAYILNVKIKQAFGLTTEIAVIITFLLGFLITSELSSPVVILVILVLLTFFLSQKYGIGLLVQRIKHEEVIDIIKFGLVSLVILPLLPNQEFTLGSIVSALNINSLGLETYYNFVLLNPFQAWLIVVLISGFNLFGYFLSRIAGKRQGMIFVGVFGGFISSTAAIVSLAHKSLHMSKKDNSSILYAGSALIANAISFILLGALLFIGNRALFTEALPILLIMLVVGLGVGAAFVSQYKFDHAKHIIELEYRPFTILPAIQFVGIIVAIKLLIQVLQLSGASNALLLAITALSGIAGMDAPAVALSNLAQTGSLTVQLALLAFLITNSINFASKVVYSYVLGNRYFARYVAVGLIITALAGLVGLML